MAEWKSFFLTPKNIFLPSLFTNLCQKEKVLVESNDDLEGNVPIDPLNIKEKDEEKDEN